MWKIIFFIHRFTAAYCGGDCLCGGRWGQAYRRPEGSGSGSGPYSDCCGISASGGGSNTVAAGLVAAAATAATIAAASDVRDPFRRGEDHTMPAAREMSLSEKANLKSAIRSLLPWADHLR